MNIRRSPMFAKAYFKAWGVAAARARNIYLQIKYNKSLENHIALLKDHLELQDECIVLRKEHIALLKKYALLLETYGAA
jgi:hypothetical protein